MTSDKRIPETRPRGEAGANASGVDIEAGDLDFVTDASAAILERSPRGGRIILWAVVAFVASALVWAAQAQIDEVTRGDGKVIPSQQVQVIQNLEGGIVAEILVREGDIVEDGQTLLRIDDTRFASSFREGRVQYLAQLAKRARLQAEAQNIEFEPPAEVIEAQPELAEQEAQLFEARKEELRKTLDILRQQANQREQELTELQAKEVQLQRSYLLLQKELDLTTPLVKDGAISEVEVLRLRRQVNDLKGDLEATRLAIPRVESKQAEAQRKIEEAELSFRNEARAELNATDAELRRLAESNLALEDRVRRTAVKSPVRGTVKQLMLNTIGGVIQPGMDMIEIVPLEDSLLVEARIRPADIGFLHPRQRAIVKFTAYDFAIYGGLNAEVEHISADTITDDQGESFYVVRVRTDRNYLGSAADPLPIIPGMQTSVDVLTGKKTVLDYLLKPVLRARELALRER